MARRKTKRPSHDEVVWIYILRYDRKLAHAQHYCGSTNRPSQRLRDHATGFYRELSLPNRTPPRLPLAFFGQEIPFKVVKLIQATREMEYKIKRRKNLSKEYKLDPDGWNDTAREWAFLRDLPKNKLIIPLIKNKLI